MNPVVHFEMPAGDHVRMAEFYTRVFGWQARMMGEEMGNYVSFIDTEGNRLSVLQPEMK